MTNEDSRVLDRRRWSEAWFKNHLIEWKLDLGEQQVTYLNNHQVESEIEKYLPQLRKRFTQKWSGTHHTDNCIAKDCSEALVIDGHMKGTRLICDNDIGDVYCEELGNINVGCMKTPLKGSYFCVDHQTYHVRISTDSSNKTNPKDDLEGLECKTDKSKQAANKHRSAGICCAVYNCGIVVAITELFGSESLAQVYVFLTWLWQTILLFPMLLAYDDECHLKRFVNRRHNTISGKFLATLMVDKLHFKNHVDKWCKQNVNPHKVAAFNSLNTEACEQTFNFISKFKHATKHMTYGSLNLFHLTICDIYNEDKMVKNAKRAK